MKITIEFINTYLDLRLAGKTDAEACVKLGISKAKFMAVLRNLDDPLLPELREAIEMANTAEEAILERIGIKLMTGEIQGKDSVWYRFIKQKAGWKDDVVIVEKEVKLTNDDLQAQLDELMKKAS
jgi:hypothetical protein